MGCRLGLGLVLLVLLALLVLADTQDATTNSSAADDKRRTLIILLDGFRWDYLKHLGEETLGFKEFIKEGVSAEYVRSVFPSLSFPAWTTISTGVYPETHGILANFFYSRQRQSVFKLNDTATTRKAYWWQQPEPLWTTATRHGLRVATMLWARSDVPVHGLRPEVARGYEYLDDTLVHLRDSLETSLEYLQRGFDLVMTYSEHLDDVGHHYGPDSLEMKYSVGDVSKMLLTLFRQMEVRNLKDKVNVILIGDHGMATVDPGDPIRLRQYLDPDTDVEQALGQGAFVSIYAKPGRVEYIYNRLASVPGLTVWRRGEVPAELHYNKNPVLPDIIVSAKKGSYMDYGDGPGYLIRGLHVKDGPAPRPSGIHGYRPDMEQMRTVFYAVGPDFRKGVQVGPFELVDEYQLFCHVLRIPAQPHNGTWERVRGLLAGEPRWPFAHEGDGGPDDLQDLEELKDLEDLKDLQELQDMKPTPIRSTEIPAAAVSFASGPVRVAVTVILGVVGWYLFLCAITNPAM